MKFALAFVFLAAFVAAQEEPAAETPPAAEGAAPDAAAADPAGLPSETPAVTLPEGTQGTTYKIRNLPADVLRDFPNLCFASTSCRVYEVGQKWDLKPFCGIATCVQEGFHLFERVEDCGILPKPNPNCTITNELDKDKPFPTCCPIFRCEPGVLLEFPTDAELRAEAERALAAAGKEGGTDPGAVA